jgi:K+-sensing histidine kinase KdpD
MSCVFHNALKFTETGKICLDVTLCATTKTLKITVTDTGSGIPQHFQSRIFKPFSREDESITRHSEGLGLGLLIARGLTQKMGGDLKLVKSSTAGPNSGSVSIQRMDITSMQTNICIDLRDPHSCHEGCTADDRMSELTQQHSQPPFGTITL